MILLKRHFRLKRRILMLCALIFTAIFAGGRAPAASLDPRVGPNLRLGDDPAILPQGLRAQAEPHMVRNPIDSNILVATFQEGRLEDGGAVDCGFSISADAGLTWSRAVLPHVSKMIDDGVFDRASDPVAAIDLNGAIYFNTLGVMGTPPALLSSVLLSRSSDGGRTVAAPRVLAASSGTTNFLDKNWLAINTFIGSRTANRMVAAFTDPDGSTLSIGIARQPIVTTFSDDAGQTWSPLRPVSSAAAIGAQPLFLPDDSLAVIYWSFLNQTGSSFDNRIEIVISSDGGSTFERPRLVARPVVHDDPVARDGFDLPAITTDRQRGVLYVAFQGENGLRPAIFFTQSMDRGQTWSVPVAINDTPVARSVFNPAIAVSPDGQHVSAIFYDKRHDDGSGDVVDLYLAESFDGGQSWGANVRLSEVSSDLRRAPLTDRGRMLGDYQAIVADVDFDFPAVACWIDTRNGSPDPFAVRIQRTRGTNFETWRRLRFSTEQLADTSISGPAADPDGDQIPNFAEYALALEPGHADDSGKMVRILTTDTSASVVTLKYSRLRTLADVAFAWEVSTDLSTWQPAQPVAASTAKNEQVLTEDVTATFTRGGRGAQFFRLALTATSPSESQ